MKRIYLLMIAGCISMTINAQDQLKSKNGAVVLPEAGDWSLSLNANPFFRYVGNIFNGTNSQNGPFVQSTIGGNTLLIRKFTSDNEAYRATFRIGINNFSRTNMVSDDTEVTPPSFPTLPRMVEDQFKSSNTNVTLGIGKEWRKGIRRLQGFYGADAMIMFSSSKREYTYGNKMSDSTIAAAGNTTTPESTTWSNGGGVIGTSAAASRPTGFKSGSTFGLGLRGFIGADYFVLPKMSIGFEFGWGLNISSTGTGETSTESTGGSPSKAGTQTMETGKRSAFGFDNDLNGGQIRLSVYF